MTLYNVQWLIVHFIKAFIKQVSMIILLLYFSSFFFYFVQNEMDDWEENEEFRTIEGLEGKYCPVQNFIVTSIINVCEFISWHFLNLNFLQRYRHSHESRKLSTQGENCTYSWWKFLFHPWKEKLVCKKKYYKNNTNDGC